MPAARPSQLRALRPKRAVLYLRQSTYREESISLELQESAGRAHAAKMGYEVIGVEADPGISGRTWKRPAVHRVLAMLEAGDADVIVLWRWSRLSRSRKDWALAVDRADIAGGSIESATEPNDVTAAGRFARGVMTELAAFESERIGEQWKEAHERRRKMGKPHTNIPRYGYELDAQGIFQPHPTESILLAEMYRRYISGEGFQRICRWLNSAGHITRTGQFWQRTSLTKILDSGFGAGFIVHNTTRGRSIKDSDFIPGTHTAVIDEDEWASYLAMRLQRPEAPRVVEPRYILSGLIKCGDCGKSMHVSTTSRRPADYTCGQARYDSRPKLSIKQEFVEADVKQWVLRLASDFDALTAIELEVEQQRVVALNTRSSVEAAIARVEQRMAKLTVRWLDDDASMPESTYKATVAQLDRELQSLRERATVDTLSRSRELVVRRTSAALAENWDAMSVIELRNTLKSLIREIVVSKRERLTSGEWNKRVRIVPIWEPDQE